MENNRKFIGFRLRKDLDDDLTAVLSEMNKKEISELCRTALRVVLEIKTQKQVQVTEVSVSSAVGKVWTNPNARTKQK